MHFTLTEPQKEILEAATIDRKFAVSAGRGFGKTTVAMRIALLHASSNYRVAYITNTPFLVADRYRDWGWHTHARTVPIGSDGLVELTHCDPVFTPDYVVVDDPIDGLLNWLDARLSQASGFIVIGTPRPGSHEWPNDLYRQWREFNYSTFHNPGIDRNMYSTVRSNFSFDYFRREILGDIPK